MSTFLFFSFSLPKYIEGKKVNLSRVLTRTIFVRNMYDCAINFYDLAFICDKKVHRQNIFHYNFKVTHYVFISKKSYEKDKCISININNKKIDKHQALAT